MRLKKKHRHLLELTRTMSAIAALTLQVLIAHKLGVL